MQKRLIAVHDLDIPWRPADLERAPEELSVKATRTRMFRSSAMLPKGDMIVETEDGCFNIYAENLNGNGSTDVAKIWAYDTDYDRIEYIFEP